MNLEEPLRILLDKEKLGGDEMSILSQFMLHTGGVVSALEELLKYSSSSGQSSIISSKHSLGQHFVLAVGLRDKIKKANRREY